MMFDNLKLFMDHMAKNRTVGNSVAVYFKNTLVFEYHSGYSDLENQTPLNGNEFYNIYSCSKVATVTAAMQLLEKGIFLLSDPLGEYIPEFSEMYIKDTDGSLRRAKNPIRIGDLFSMTAGFTYDLDADWIRRAEEVTNGRFDTLRSIRELAKDPISYEPGTHWQYSLAHDVLVALVCATTGKTFREYMKKNIFEPLGMNNTVYHTTPEITKKTAEQYTFVPSDGDLDDLVEAQKSGSAKSGTFKNSGKGNVFVFGDEYDSGGAGIITTLSDYSKLAAALANGGTGVGGARILSPQSIELMKTNRLTDELLKDFNWQQLRGYGYGLGVRTHMNPAISGSIAPIGSFGWAGAAGSNVIIDSTLNLAAFYTQHVLNPREEYYQPRLINALYSDIG